MSEISLELKNIKKSFQEGEDVLESICLTAKKGEFVTLLGSSGCGKTTLMRLVAGLEKADAGTISGLDGAKISMVFQEDRLLPWCTAEQNIALAVPGSDAAFWMEQSGIADARRKLPDELSGGMRRRVAIARALAYAGDLFLLDEPFKALDDATRARMIACTMQAVEKKTAILVTHELTEAAAMADTVLLLEGPPLRIIRTVSLPIPSSGRRPEQIRIYCNQLDQARSQ